MTTVYSIGHFAISSSALSGCILLLQNFISNLKALFHGNSSTCWFLSAVSCHAELSVFMLSTIKPGAYSTSYLGTPAWVLCCGSPSPRLLCTHLLQELGIQVTEEPRRQKRPSSKTSLLFKTMILIHNSQAPPEICFLFSLCTSRNKLQAIPFYVIEITWMWLFIQTLQTWKLQEQILWRELLRISEWP